MHNDQPLHASSATRPHAARRLAWRLTAAAVLAAGSAAALAAEFKWIQDAKSCAAPEYPRESLAKNEQGTVVVRVLVAPDGKVVDSEVEASSRSRRLDEAARKALSLCAYKPTPADAKPVQQWVAVQYVWKID